MTRSSAAGCGRTPAGSSCGPGTRPCSPSSPPATAGWTGWTTGQVPPAPARRGRGPRPGAGRGRQHHRDQHPPRLVLGDRRGGHRGEPRSCRRPERPSGPTAAGTPPRRSRSSRAPTAAAASPRSAPAATPASWGAASSSGPACAPGASRRWTPSGWAPTSTAPSPSSCASRRPRSSPVDSSLSDAELGAVPCAYGTAENMVSRAGVRRRAARRRHRRLRRRRVRRGAARAAARRRGHGGGRRRQGRAGAGARRDPGRRPGRATGRRPWGAFGRRGRRQRLRARPRRPLSTLRRGGSYVSSGAIAGPVVSFDKRTLYLRDLRLIGCTAWDEPVFPALIAYIEAGELRPVVATTFPLERIAEAQTEFLEKRHVGKYVLVPPPA